MSDKKKNFYVVVKGRKPGIYTQWGGPGGAEEQIKGHPGAIFRGFATRAEAEQYLRAGGQGRPASPALFADDPIKPSTPPAPSGGRTSSSFERPAAAERPASASAAARAAEHLPDLAAGKVIIFTDGASTGNPGPGGYGAIILSGETRRELSGGFRCTTNNRMELLGVISALRAVDGPAVVYSDSRYVVDAVEKGWARRWRSRGWMRDGTNRAENTDLWAQLLELLDRRPVEFRWVRGHAAHPENERCDQLAVEAAHQKGLPPDAGFQGKC
jgi:ribonuclease HI